MVKSQKFDHLHLVYHFSVPLTRFSCKNGHGGWGGYGSPYKRGGGRGIKHCFSLVMYGFCSSSALYSASFSFKMFIFILTPFDTWDCYYFGLNLSLILLLKVFFVYPVFHWGDIVENVWPKVGDMEKKKIKKGNNHVGGVVFEGLKRGVGVKPSAQYVYYNQIIFNQIFVTH